VDGALLKRYSSRYSSFHNNKNWAATYAVTLKMKMFYKLCLQKTFDTVKSEWDYLIFINQPKSLDHCKLSDMNFDDAFNGKEVSISKARFN
jgi:hypothetical protein